MVTTRITRIVKLLLVLLVALSLNYLTPASSLCAEKVGVLFLSVGEGESYNADWIVQFFNNMFDVFDPGFFAGGPLEGGTCYTLVHYANEAEAYICGVALGTPIDQFGHEYTGPATVDTLMDYWGNDYETSCSTFITPAMYVLTFGHNTVNPSTEEFIWGPVVVDPDGTGIGIADFLEMDNFLRMDLYYRLPDHMLPYRKQLFKLWYGNDAPGYSPDLPELPNVKDTLEAEFPQYEFVFRHGWEAYMENENAYGNPSYIPESTETAIQELIAAGVKRIVVVDTYSSFGNLTQFGHEWYDNNGNGVSELPGKTFKQCVEDITDAKGPKTQPDLNTYLANKPWNTHWKHPFPLIKDLVQNEDPTVDLRFAPAYGGYEEYESAVLDLLNYTIGKYTIPSTASLKVILLTHGFSGSYKSAQECDAYFRLADDLATRVVARVTDGFTWQGKLDVVSAPLEFAEGTDDPATAGKPFGNVVSVGETIDSSINGHYVDGLGQNSNNGDDNFKYIIVIPISFESESSDTVYGIREKALANNNYSSAYGVYDRDSVDQDGTKFDAGDLDAEYFTIKTYNASGWPGVPGCIENPSGCKYNTPVNKGSATNPTTLILSGTILSLDSSNLDAYAARQGLTQAVVRAITDSLSAPTTTTTTTVPTITTTTISPTLVTLAEFNAVLGNQTVTLLWRTESEINNAGFNIYRADGSDGAYQKINAALISAKGSSTQGAAYEFTDTNVQNRKAYYYKLEDIDLNGNSTMHGPVSATPRWFLGIFGK